MAEAGVLPIAVVSSRWLAIGTVLVTGGHFLGVPALPTAVTLALAGLGLIVGIPHGAVDHLVATRLTGGRSLATVAAGYAAIAAAAWALLQWAGPIALIAVVAVSALHFGLGELETARLLTGWRPGPVPTVAIVVAGSGALALPLARSGDQFSAVATAVSPGLAHVLAAAPLHAAVMAAWAVAALIAVAASLRCGHREVALDVVLIGALGMVAPPLVAFAVWFGGWHAVRHSARLLSVEPGCAALLSAGRRRAATLRLVRLGALPSVAALSTVGVLAYFTVAAPDPTTVLAEVLRVLLALTVPHMVVVMWLDRTADAGRGRTGAAVQRRADGALLGATDSRTTPARRVE